MKTFLPLNKKVKVNVVKVKLLKSETHLSVRHMLIFTLIFAAIGAYFIFHSFAATTAIVTYEAEAMTLPAGATMISDSTASGGKYLRLTTRGPATGTPLPAPLTSAVTNLSVRARATACTGTVQMIVKLNGTQVQSTAVTSSSWTELPQVPITAAAGTTPQVSVEMNSDPYTQTAGNSGNIKCQRKLEVDKVTLYGSDATPPAPLTVKVDVPASGTPVSGGVPVQATPTATTPNTVTKVEFYLDGTLKATEGIAPYCMAADAGAGTPCYNWDSTTVANSTTDPATFHTIKAVAYDSAGTTAEASVTFKVDNSTSVNPKPMGVPGTWTLKFQEEFEGTSLDTAKWNPNWFGDGGKMNNVGTYAANVSVSNGSANLMLASSTSGALIHTGYTAGRYQLPIGGFAEARIYFSGSSTEQWYNWSGFWASGPNWPAAGEHDIAEGLSGTPTVNYHSPSGSHNQGAVPGIWGSAYHTYGLHRKATSADVYWDGTLVKSYPTDDNGAGEELIFNVGTSDRTPQLGAAGQIKVDYVRAWQ